MTAEWHAGAGVTIPPLLHQNTGDIMYAFKKNIAQWMVLVEEGGFSREVRMEFTNDINRATVTLHHAVPFGIRQSKEFKSLTPVKVSVTRRVEIIE